MFISGAFNSDSPAMRVNGFIDRHQFPLSGTVSQLPPWPLRRLPSGKCDNQKALLPSDLFSFSIRQSGAWVYLLFQQRERACPHENCELNTNLSCLGQCCLLTFCYADWTGEKKKRWSESLMARRRETKGMASGGWQS